MKNIQTVKLNTLLFHVTSKNEYKQNSREIAYGFKEIEKIGFVPCVEFNQIINFSNKNFKDIYNDMVVLCIDASRLKSEIKWESNENSNIISPNVYGLINKDSIIDVVDLNKDIDGNFCMSDKLLNFSHYEKSCGAVIAHKFGKEYKVLLIGFMMGNKLIWGFPKGHAENGETEIQTAIREVKEEVGLNVNIIPEFRTSTCFSMKKGTINEAVYYCAESNFIEVIPQKGEVDSTKWLNFDNAYDLLTYECDKKILVQIIDFYKKLHNIK